jgi:hypothetical protein
MGWLVISNKITERYASVYKDATRPFTNHPVCADTDALRHLLTAQPPLLENGGEWARLEPTHSPSGTQLLAGFHIPCVYLSILVHASARLLSEPARLHILHE